jgi:hypothetical protein
MPPLSHEGCKIIVDETRKYGLSLLAFHQRIDQLPKDIAAALTGCKVKLIFSTADSPKPKRHFECRRRNKETQMALVPQVKPHPLRSGTIQEYKRSILRPVDRPQLAIENEEEWDAKDYYKKR